jgi:hypothetical protein
VGRTRDLRVRHKCEFCVMTEWILVNEPHFQVRIDDQRENEDLRRIVCDG